MRFHSSLVKAIERAVHDLVRAVSESFTPRKGADAKSHTVGSRMSRHVPPSAYSACPLCRDAVSSEIQSGAYVQPASAQAMICERAAAIATLRPRETGPGQCFKLHVSSRIGISVE